MSCTKLKRPLSPCWDFDLKINFQFFYHVTLSFYHSPAPAVSCYTKKHFLQHLSRHQVQPSVNLSYTGQGVSSSTISLGVGDEVSRGCNSQETEEETRDSLTEPPSKSQPHPDQSQQPLENVPGSSSSPSPSTSTRPPPTTKSQTITTSTSSPAICNMESEPATAGWAASSRGSSGPVSGMAGSSSHGTRASELNVGPALGKLLLFSL